MNLSAAACRVFIVRKPNGDQVFTMNSAVKRFGLIEHVKRYSYRAVSFVRAMPAFTDEVLYVSKTGSVIQSLDSYPLKTVKEDDNSLSMDSETENSPTHWTPVPSPPSDFFALPKGVSPSDEIDLREIKLQYYVLCKNRRTRRDSAPHFAGIPGVDINRSVDFVERFSAMMLWSLQSLKTELRDLATVWTVVKQIEPLMDKMIVCVQELQSQDNMD
ncbi:hypothetical protein BG015_005543 [Linnemannia schmuckeri]|uniref:Uncharacterized protein n=1 Tax=Linnemannia schmuckeri TaxID=64567 RepID=A0A9P5S319_9FUNG|nr:hypothetical protein BG015_005543 [Linnemannia schmuckeri]